MVKCKNIVPDITLKAALTSRQEVVDTRVDSILNKGHQDEIIDTIKNDKTIRLYVREMCQNDNYNGNDIRSKICSVSRIFLKMKCTENSLVNLSDLYHKKHWSLFVGAVNFEALYDPLTNYKKASVALNIGYTFKKIAR